MRVDVLIRVVADPDEETPIENDIIHVHLAHSVMGAPDDNPLALLATDMEETMDMATKMTRDRIAIIADQVNG